MNDILLVMYMDTCDTVPKLHDAICSYSHHLASNVTISQGMCLMRPLCHEVGVYTALHSCVIMLMGIETKYLYSSSLV